MPPSHRRSETSRRVARLLIGPAPATQLGVKNRTAYVLLLCLAHVAGTVTGFGKGADEFLRKQDDWFRSAAGQTVISNVLSWQSAEGSWPKNTNTFGVAFTGDRSRLKGTFDNSATTDELRFLARAFKATGDSRSKEACARGVEHVLKAQYPTGGWPQYYPPPKSTYHRHITFNDDAMVRVMIFLREVAHNNDWGFLGSGQRTAASAAFARGIDCILRCQVKVDGRLTAWCAQHDEIDLRPRPGRAFELVSLSGAESVGIVRLLMSVDKPSSEIIRSVDAAVAWFESVKISGIRVVKQDSSGPKGWDKVVVPDKAAPPLWARFYEIGTNKPIFAGRDGVKKDRLADIEYERRNGYAWLGDWPARLLTTEYPEWKGR